MLRAYPVSYTHLDVYKRQVKEAAEFEAQDKKRKEGIDARNDADSMVCLLYTSGSYITLEADQLSRKDEDYHREVSEELARQIGRLLEGKNYRSSSYHVLAVGLGNSSVTPDSLGPRVLHNLQVTRHLKVQYGDEFWSGRSMPVISGIVPGVMAQTGMESAEILKGIIHETKPDLIIAIDALAARSVKRLGTTIQLTDTGIHPGSGVGNHRHSLTEESLGVPVMAIGVPTVSYTHLDVYKRQMKTSAT